MARMENGPIDQESSQRAARHWWDAEAADYYAEHGHFLGDDALVWGPEGWTEEDLKVLGEVRGRTVLEFGAGAAQGARYLAGRGARVIASDLSAGMLQQRRAIEQRVKDPIRLPLVQCDATALPFADDSFDLVFSAYGAVPFVADLGSLLRECYRVLRPGGRLAFSTSHPMRWCFPDDPSEAGLLAQHSYFDRTPYSETENDTVVYVEHHRTLGDVVRAVVAAGLVVQDLLEPEWPDRNRETWGGWSPLRGRLFPGTMVVCAGRPPTP